MILNLAGLALAGLVAAYVLRRQLFHPATLLSLGVVLELFSGNWSYFGLPLGPDRVLIALALALAVRRWWRSRKRVLARGDLLIIIAVASVDLILSAYLAGSLSTSTGLFSLLDRAGLLPFAAFALGSLLYRKERSRDILLALLTIAGAYLSLTALAEMAIPGSPVWPAYIGDPNAGIHYGRARGPFLESAMNGLVITMCAVAAGVGVYRWSHKLARVAAGATIVLCAVGAFLTLTRAVWLAFLAALIVGLIQHRFTRRLLAPVLAGTAVVLVGFLALVPSVLADAQERGSNSLSVYDRINSNEAAVSAFFENPVFGVGLEQFRIVGNSYMEQGDSYPLTGAGLIVHNVFLSNLAELGLVGFTCWFVAFVACVVLPCFRRKPYEDPILRIGLGAVLAAWFVVSMLGPTTAAMPTLLLWLWAGIVNPVFLPKVQEAKDTAREPVPTDDPANVASP